ncbi:MAG: UDP-glucose 4-epimerase GalE [Planctomycetota bacterium]
MAVLVTGGAGYIGSHLVKALVESGYHPIAFDNLSEGHRSAVRGGHIVEGDLKNFNDLHRVFTNYKIDGVFHLAARCYIEESVTDPQTYYLNNLLGTLNLLRAMIEFNCKNIIFSSSCATYGSPEYLPLDEDHPLKPISPYGRSKLYAEEVMLDYARSYGVVPVILRYFNAAGADAEGEIGEAHRVETHLIPITIKVILGQKDSIKVYGTDYDTPDGTCIRDYVHVSDIASVHIAAYEKHLKKPLILNIGTGKGNSVLEVIKTVEKITGKKVKTEFTERRAGDPSTLTATVDKAKKELNWEPMYTDLESIVETAWRWSKNHPNSYADESKAQKEYFGEIAIKKGFISHEDLEKCLFIQKEMDKLGTHKLLGMIMLNEGVLSNEQLIEILRYMEEKGHKKHGKTNRKEV